MDDIFTEKGRMGDKARAPSNKELQHKKKNQNLSLGINSKFEVEHMF